MPSSLTAWVKKAGLAASYFSLFLLIVIIIQVLLRVLFSGSSIILEELQWHFYAVLFLIGLSYADLKDAHVRVDIFRSHYSKQTKARFEFWGSLLFVYPFVLIVAYHSIPFFWDSFIRAERSLSPGGLPARWALKAVLPSAFLLLLISRTHILIEAWAVLKKNSSSNRSAGEETKP